MLSQQKFRHFKVRSYRISLWGESEKRSEASQEHVWEKVTRVKWEWGRAANPSHGWEVVWQVEHSREHSAGRWDTWALLPVSSGTRDQSLNILLPSWRGQKGWAEFPLRCSFLPSCVAISSFNGDQTIGSSGKRILYCYGRIVSFPQGHTWKGNSPEPRKMLSFTKDLRNSENQEVLLFASISITSLPHRRIWFGTLFT